MAPEVFVDTSGFYALLVKRDDRHDKARALLGDAARSCSRFWTTDYVLDETATLLAARALDRLIPTFFDVVLSSKACDVAWTDPERFHAAKRFFLKHLDQGWSFTDCLSFCVMNELGLKKALTKDDHFNRAGFSALLARER